MTAGAEKKIGIAGFGFVGQALYASMKDAGRARIYDKYKAMGQFLELMECDHIFCCLPTPMGKDGVQDFVEYQGLLEEMIRLRYSGILIVKSTVLFDNLHPYEGKLNIVFNPEFLNQDSAVNDFKRQRVVILGGRMDHCRKVQEVYQTGFSLDPNVEFEFCTLKEAIEIKYVHNIYHAYKALFWNFVHTQTGNHRRMFKLYSKVVGVPNEMANVGSDGKLGYGGACFPKDVKAFEAERPHVLTKFMSAYNQALRGDVDNQI